MSRQTIRALLFDLGGVLLRTEDPNPRAALEARLGLAAGEAEHLVFHGTDGTAAQLGRITAGQLWARVGHRLALDAAGLRRFRRQFFAGDHIHRPLLAVVRELGAQYQTALVSNAMDDLGEVIGERYPIADAFDLVVGSAGEGVMKPDPAIYLRTLEQLGRQPAEAVLIDDAVANVEGARAVGIHGIHCTPDTDVAAQLRRLGVRIDAAHPSSERTAAPVSTSA